MKNMMIRKAVGLLMCVLAAVVCAEDAYYDYNADFHYVEEPTNPRSVGMGCAGTAAGRGGFSFYNPAVIPATESSFVAFSFGRQFGDRSYGHIETGWTFPEWFIGASFETQSTEFSLTDYTGSEILPGMGSEQASQLVLALGWRTSRYAIAVAANGLHHRIAEYDAYALSASGGVTVMVIPRKFTAGASVIQAGRLHRGFYDTTFTPHRVGMPTTGRVGGVWNDTLFGKLPVNVALDATYGSNYGTVTIPLGVELWPLPPLAVRFGKRFNFERDLFTFGVGIKWENISFDAAFTPTTTEGDIDLKWLMGLRYALLPPKRIPRQAPVVQPKVEVPENRPVPAVREVVADSVNVISVTTIDTAAPVPVDTTAAAAALPNETPVLPVAPAVPDTLSPVAAPPPGAAVLPVGMPAASDSSSAAIPPSGPSEKVVPPVAPGTAPSP